MRKRFRVRDQNSFVGLRSSSQFSSFSFSSVHPLEFFPPLEIDPLQIFETTHGERGETCITWRNSDKRWRERSGGQKERKWCLAVVGGFSSSTDASVWYDADSDVCYFLKHAQIRLSRRDHTFGFLTLHLFSPKRQWLNKFSENRLFRVGDWRAS